MIKGMYSSASGMIPRVKQQEAIANNIANATSSGFKKDGLFIRELAKAERKTTRKQADWHQPMVTKTFVDQTQGTLDRTNNPTDLAIDGEGFFRLQAPNGDILLTRSGAFQVDSEGYLVYPGGYKVMGESGPIQIGDGQISIAQTGEVEVDGTIVARIMPVTVMDINQLDKIGAALFALPDSAEATPVAQPIIQQGYLESANVDVVRQMVDMIIAYRMYEANAKSLQSQDTSLDHLFNRVAGRP